MSTYGAAIVARNDNYGGDLVEKASYVLNAALETMDEVIYVDWNSDGNNLVTDLKNNLIYPERLKYIVVTPDMAKRFTNYQEVTQPVSEVLARNIGISRLSTDFLISTNIDVLVPPRRYLETIKDVTTMYAIPKYMLSWNDIKSAGGMKEDVRETLIEFIAPNGDMFNTPGMGKQGKTALFEGDIWSMVNGCGDFQIAHRHIWYDIKGFEESLLGRGYADSNLHKKAWLAGYNIDVLWDLFVFHIGHDNGNAGGANAGVGYWNDGNLAVKEFTTSTNTGNWGFFDDEELKIQSL